MKITQFTCPDIRSRVFSVIYADQSFFLGEIEEIKPYEVSGLFFRSSQHAARTVGQPNHRSHISLAMSIIGLISFS
jgi:hypothetical protein